MIKITDFPELVIYHSPCSDGFTAAWAVHKRFGKGLTTYCPGIYETNASDLDYWLSIVKNKRVLILDFSFPREILITLKEAAKSLTLIDHHKSAQEELGDLPYCYFDMTKSGALLTWEACHDKPAPNLVKYISDHDLWQHELPHSYELSLVIGHQQKTFATWDWLEQQLRKFNENHRLVLSGKAILEFLQDISTDMLKKVEAWSLGGEKIMAVNTASPFVNEMCDMMRQKWYSVAAYEVFSDKVKFSLRSRPEVDISRIAKRYPGGGGHKNSAAFTVPVEKVDFKRRRVLL